MPATAADVDRWAREDFRLELRDLRTVPHGADQSAQVWQAEAVDGRRFAVKLTGAGSAAGLLAPHLLVQAGIAGIPPMCLAQDGRVWSDHDGRRLSVSAWIDGPRAADVELTAVHWRALGSLLREVHDFPVPPELAAVMPAPTSLTADLLAAARALDDRCAAIQDPPAISDDISHAAAEAWRAARDLVSTAAAAATELERASARRPVGISHTDPHLGNVLVDGPDRLWLIDWDDVTLAPRERDLMFALVGVPLFGPVTPEQRGPFLAGYGTLDLDLDHDLDLHHDVIAFYAVTRALEDATDWTRRALDVHLAPTQRREALAISRELASRQGLLTRACKLLSAGSAAG